jgi:hypothetical protein
MASSSPEFYDWLNRVTTLIRALKDPQEHELFEIFCRELSHVFQFDELAKYDAASNTFDECVAAPWHGAPVVWLELE